MAFVATGDEGTNDERVFAADRTSVRHGCS